jgi:hypothetical protein
MPETTQKMLVQLPLSLYIYIYKERERERERDKESNSNRVEDKYLLLRAPPPTAPEFRPWNLKSQTH